MYFNRLRGKAMKTKHNKFKITLVISGIILILALCYNFNQVYSRKLINAIMDNDVERVRELIEQPGNVNSLPYIYPDILVSIDISIYYPLHWACKVGNYEMVEMLINEGADINLKDPTVSRMPLSFAVVSASEERYKIIELLLDKGADSTTIDGNNSYALFECIIVRDVDDEEIREQSAVVFKRMYAENEKEKDNMHDLIYASENLLTYSGYFSNKPIAQFLIKEKGFDVNSVSVRNETALISSAQNKSSPFAYEYCEYLISMGADKTIRDKHGKSAYDYAIENENGELAELLKPADFIDGGTQINYMSNICFNI